MVLDTKKRVSKVSALMLLLIAVIATVLSWQLSSNVISEDDYSAASYQVSGQLAETVKNLQKENKAMKKAGVAMAVTIAKLSKQVASKASPNGVTIVGPASPSQGKQIATLDFQGRTSYIFSFETTMKSISQRWGSMFHIGNHNHGRLPALYQFPGRTGIAFQQAGKNGNYYRWNWGCDMVRSQDLPLNRAYRVYVRASNKLFSVFVNGKLLCRVTMDIAVPLRVHRVYFASPWHLAANVVIRDLQFRLV